MGFGGGAYIKHTYAGGGCEEVLVHAGETNFFIFLCTY